MLGTYIFALSGNVTLSPFDNDQLTCMLKNHYIEMFTRQVSESTEWEGFTGCPYTYRQAQVDPIFSMTDDLCTVYYHAVLGTTVQCCYHEYDIFIS